MTDVSAWEPLAERFVISEEEASFSRPLSLPLEAASYSGVFMEGETQFPSIILASGFLYACLPKISPLVAPAQPLKGKQFRPKQKSLF